MTGTPLTFLEQRFKPLIINASSQGKIISWQGSLETFGVPSQNTVGIDVAEILPCLYLLPEGENTFLPFINLSNGTVADINVEWNNDGYQVTLIDTTEFQANQQETQQLANSVNLLNKKLQKLSEKIQEKNLQLDVANQAKSNFISGLSHEFRTPLASILGHTRWLSSQQGIGEELNPHLETIVRSGEYLLALIENLLRQGSVDAKKLVLNPTPVSLRNILQSIIDMIAPLAREKNVRLTGHLDLDPQALYELDENHLRQVIINLITNAIKFTDQGVVTLTASETGKQLIITVADTGIGIAAHDLNNITSAFTRGGNANQRPGLGLGLSIAHGIITAMEGELSIQSIERQGTNVVVTLPGIKPSLESEAIDAPNTYGTIVLLDDNRDITNLYKLYFQQAGIPLKTYHDPNHCLLEINSIKPSLILTDYHLINSDGLSFTKELRAQGHNHPTILLTATMDVEASLKTEALAAGCNDCWRKPMDVSILINDIKRLLADTPHSHE